MYSQWKLPPKKVNTLNDSQKYKKVHIFSVLTFYAKFVHVSICSFLWMIGDFEFAKIFICTLPGLLTYHLKGSTTSGAVLRCQI